MASRDEIPTTKVDPQMVRRHAMEMMADEPESTTRDNPLLSEFKAKYSSGGSFQHIDGRIYTVLGIPFCKDHDGKPAIFIPVEFNGIKIDLLVGE